MDRQNIVLASRVVNKGLRQDVSTLRNNLKQLINVSKRNVEIQQKMDELGDVVLQCHDLETFIARSSATIREHFGLTAVTFCLAKQFTELLPAEPEHIKSPTAEKLFFADAEKLAEIFSRNPGPLLRGRLENGSVGFFSLREFRRVHSEALTPLYFDGEYLGSLNLGSSDPDRYAEGVATDYLRRLSHLMSLCLANLRLKRLLDLEKEKSG
jgi:uncharacterized protein YigA (DUF484 family)